MILRLTCHVNGQKCDPDDVVLDAHMVYMVITDTAKSTGEQLAVLYLRSGINLAVKDPHRDVQQRWMNAICEMEEA